MSAFSDIITYTRASAAWQYNKFGSLEQVAANQPRFDYDPVSLALKGLLVEEQRTNAISNSSATGAAVGTLPTGWSLSLQSGVTGSVVAVGAESGLNYVDIRFQGTIASAGLELSVLPAASVAASPGQVWACSWFVKLVGGSLAGVSETRTRVIARTSGSAYIGSDNTSFTMPVSAAQLSACRRGAIYTLPANSGLVQAAVTAVCAAGAIDFTLRLALPQLELGGSVTSPVPTAGSQVTRATDVVSVNTLSPWFNPDEGTLFAEFSRSGLRPPGQGSGFFELSGSPPADQLIALQSGVSTPAQQRMLVRAAAVDQALLQTASSAVPGVTYKLAGAYRVNDFAACQSGGTVLTDASGVLPSGINLARLGVNLNGYLRRVRYWPRRLSNAELQALTA